MSRFIPEMHIQYQLIIFELVRLVGHKVGECTGFPIMDKSVMSTSNYFKYSHLTAYLLI